MCLRTSRSSVTILCEVWQHVVMPTPSLRVYLSIRFSQCGHRILLCKCVTLGACQWLALAANPETRALAATETNQIAFPMGFSPYLSAAIVGPFLHSVSETL
jgi:hypothetical protein